ncbi:MAG TPA: PIG-L deacetylase family protein [Jatrophihabitantaceae bacterium]|jgi:4-oxalomesaconate hydratase|nr:PIG-L deacetylase family protein [Jatrophihabitantaceae bacterium]
MSERRLLVVGAHSADFVWRAAGTIAAHTGRGGRARVIALSYGERGESGELWKQPDQTEANVKQIRHAEAEKAAAAVGAEFAGFDLGDYPLEVGRDGIRRLADEIREFAPHVIVTHPRLDPFNPDHPAAHDAVAKAKLLTSGAGVASAFKTIKPAEFFVFEPHQPELCGFVPSTYVDITAVMDAKRAAIDSMAAQSYLGTYYEQRAEQRANHARKVTGNADIRYAEAFQRLLPNVVEAL